MKLYTKLVGLQFKVIYKLGATNTAADALSRHPAPLHQINAISSASPTWLSDIAAGYTSDTFLQKLLQDLSLDLDSRPPYSLANGIIYIGSRIWVGDNKMLQHRILDALHASAIGGNSGFP